MLICPLRLAGCFFPKRILHKPAAVNPVLKESLQGQLTAFGRGGLIRQKPAKIGLRGD